LTATLTRDCIFLCAVSHSTVGSDSLLNADNQSESEDPFAQRGC